MTEPFVDQLAELCRAEPTRAKWVFVPAHALGLTLGERLAREGCDWANLRFVTPLDIAIRMAAPFLLERGINPSEEPLGPALVMRLLLELDLPQERGYFRPMAEHPSMVDALWRTVRELRYAGVRAADLPASAFAPAAKHAELVALLTAYERHLETERIADMPMALQEAGGHLDWCPIDKDDVVTELPDVLWSPLVRRFLDRLPGRRLRSRALELVEARVPARAAQLAAPVDRIAVTATTDAGRLRFLQSPGTAPKPRNDGSLEVFHAGGRDAEVAEVLRRVAASGKPLDQVEIACASDDHALLIWEKAQRLDWRVTVSSGMPAVLTRPGCLLLRYCEWAGGNFASSDLRRLLQSGDCAPKAFESPATAPATDADAALTPGQAARLLLKAETTWGRDTYPPSLARLAGIYDEGARDSEASAEDRTWQARKAAQTRTLAAWIAGVLATIPSSDIDNPKADNKVSLGAVAAAAIAFLNANASRASALDAMAVVALESALADLVNVLGTHRCDLALALGFIRARIESLAVGRDRPRSGALHISSLADAGFDGRRLLFIVGLLEGGVFPPAIEDAVLLDAERQAISPLLRTSNDQLDEAVWAALSRLATIGVSATHVCLSFSCRDTRQFRDSFPSWIILQAFRLMMGDASLTYADLAGELGEPKSAVPSSPGAALTDAEWWLAGATRKAAARPHVLAAFPSLAGGIVAEDARASDEFTKFDGYVPEAGAVLDPSQNGRATSATTLEKAAKCPFSYFLRQGLGVRPIEESSFETDAWLDPLTKGAELHALFARFMRTLRDEQRKPNVRGDLDQLRAWGQERLDALKVEMPPPSDEVHARESREFLDDLEAFLVAECEGRHGADPVGFEVGFGFPLDDSGDEPLASAESLVLDLGNKRTLVLHGWIDRINRICPGEYEIVDYKTGGYWADDWQGKFAGGTRLQHAIYGIVVAPLLEQIDANARLVRGVYLFPAVKGYRKKKEIPAPPKTKVLEVLRDLADVIGSGVFVSADAEGACKWCEFAAACRPGAVDCVATMRDNPTNKMLDPYRRLRGHE